MRLKQIHTIQFLCNNLVLIQDNLLVQHILQNPVKDWYDAQTLGINNATVYWKKLAPKPISSNFVTDRNGKNDAIHVVVVDD